MRRINKSWLIKTFAQETTCFQYDIFVLVCFVNFYFLPKLHGLREVSGSWREVRIVQINRDKKSLCSLVLVG